MTVLSKEIALEETQYFSNITIDPNSLEIKGELIHSQSYYYYLAAKVETFFMCAIICLLITIIHFSNSLSFKVSILFQLYVINFY
jgi:hypothetical protein